MALPAECTLLLDNYTGVATKSKVMDVRGFNEVSLVCIGWNEAQPQAGIKTAIIIWGMRRGSTTWEVVRLRLANNDRNGVPAEWWGIEQLSSVPVRVYVWDNIPSCYAYMRISITKAISVIANTGLTVYATGRKCCPVTDAIPLLTGEVGEADTTPPDPPEPAPRIPILPPLDPNKPNGVEPTACATFAWSTPPGGQYDPVGWIVSGWEFDVFADIPNGIFLLNNGISTHSASDRITGYGNPAYPTVFSWKLNLCVTDHLGALIDGKLHVTTDISDEIVDCVSTGFTEVTYYSPVPIGPFTVEALQDDGLAWPCVRGVCMGGDPGLRT